MMSSFQATTDQPPARVAKALLCQDQGCTILSSPHLSIDILEVPIRRDQAVAISYTWGEFDRTLVPIGHLNNNGSKIISIELGREWILPDFIKRLDSLSSKSPIWLDQLCIPQKDEEIEQALAKIPTIYRTFDVMVLMPGRPCKCLGKFLEESRAAGAPGGALDVAMRIKKYTDCFNFTAPSSWALRLWTRQELMYSRRISCVWASETVPQCVPQSYQDEDVVNLTPYFAALRESLLSQDNMLEEEVRLALKRRLAKVDAYGIAEMMAYVRSSTIAFHQFLGGETLENSSRMPESVHDFMRGFEFVVQGLDTGNGTRTATQPHDYVLSVWVDCDQYNLPPGFKKLSFGRVLQNALDQMGTNHNWNLLTTAPRGLFESTNRNGPSACWHPEQYFDSVEVQSLRDVYSPVFTFAPFFHSVAEGRVPFRLARGNERTLALSAEAIDYDVFLESLAESYGADHQELAKLTLVSLLNRMVLKWAKLRSSRIIQEDTSTAMSNHFRELIGPLDVRQPESQVLKELLFTFIMDTLQCNDNSAADFETISRREIHDSASRMLEERGCQWGLQDVKRPLYKMISMALGLNMDVCLANGVRIMVGGKGPDNMRLGFYRGDIDITSLKSRAKTHEVKSVKMNFHFLDHRDIPKGGDLIYEALKVDGVYNPAPFDFEVFGVWIPLHDKSEGGWNAEVLQPLHTYREGRQELGGYLF